MKYVTFDPRISLGIWITLAVAAVLLLGLYAVTSRRRLAGQRWLVVILLISLVLAIPMIVLLNPTWVERVPPPAGKPGLVVLLDRSASMATIDGEVRESRYEIAAKTACRLAEQLESQYDVQFKIFDQASAPTTADEFSEMMPEGPLTDLASAVRTALEEDRPQGQALVVLSDGIQNVGGPDGLRDAAARANAVATPIFAQVIGGTAEINDLEVKLDLPEEIAFIDQEITTNVRLKQRGNTAAKCRLRVLRDGKLHSENTATLRPNGETVEIVKLREEKPGLFRYEIAVEPLVGEVTDVNNTATLLLRVMDQPVRVLLLEGNPYWDTKFLIRTLAADRLTELVSFVQLTPGRVLERRVVSQTAATAPGKTDGTDKSDSVNSGISESDSSDTQADETSKDSVQAEDAWAIHENTDSLLTSNDSFAPYQIVVLGRDAGVFLTPEVVTRLEKWVSEGNGSLVCYRGAPVSNVSERLATLLPVRWAPARESRFRVQWAESAAPPVGCRRWVTASRFLTCRRWHKSKHPGVLGR